VAREIGRLKAVAVAKAAAPGCWPMAVFFISSDRADRRKELGSLCRLVRSPVRALFDLPGDTPLSSDVTI
jgi:hypothetical protein